MAQRHFGSSLSPASLFVFAMGGRCAGCSRRAVPAATTDRVEEVVLEDSVPEERSGLFNRPPVPLVPRARAGRGALEEEAGTLRHECALRCSSRACLRGPCARRGVHVAPGGR